MALKYKVTTLHKAAKLFEVSVKHVTKEMLEKTYVYNNAIKKGMLAHTAKSKYIWLKSEFAPTGKWISTSTQPKLSSIWIDEASDIGVEKLQNYKKDTLSIKPENYLPNCTCSKCLEAKKKEEKSLNTSFKCWGVYFENHIWLYSLKEEYIQRVIQIKKKVKALKLENELLTMGQFIPTIGHFKSWKEQGNIIIDRRNLNPYQQKVTHKQSKENSTMKPVLGQAVKILNSNKSHHGYGIGQTYLIGKVSGENYYLRPIANSNTSTSYCHADEFEMVHKTTIVKLIERDLSIIKNILTLEDRVAEALKEKGATPEMIASAVEVITGKVLTEESDVTMSDEDPFGEEDEDEGDF